MLENLKIAPEYDGFLFLAESIRNPPVLRPHHHIELEVNLVIKGTVTYVVHGKRYRFGKRSLLWFFPRQEHQLVDRTPDAAYYVMVFKPELLDRVCRSQRYDGLKQQDVPSKEVLHTELEPYIFDELRLEMKELVADGMDPDLLNREAGFGLSVDFKFRHNDPDFLNAGLGHLLLRCWRLQQERFGIGREVDLHPAVRKALQWLDSEEEEMDLNTIAKKCNVSDAYLSRIFNRQIGVSLSRYRNFLRLSRFWHFYRKQNSSTVLDAAFAAGFGSYAQFYRVFVEAYGCGPRKLSKKSEA